MSLIRCPECSKRISDRAASCPSCGCPMDASAAEPEFRAFRKRALKGSLVLCLVAVPIGLSLDLWPVWGLALLGIIVATAKLVWPGRGRKGLQTTAETRKAPAE